MEDAGWWVGGEGENVETSAGNFAFARGRGKDGWKDRGENRMEEVAMRLRTLFLAGWIGLGGIAYGQDRGPSPSPTEPRKLQLEAAPMPTPASNQFVADAIASALSKNPSLQGYRIDVVYVGGVAELQGQVKNAEQREVAKQTAMAIPGVAQVRDRLALTSAKSGWCRIRFRCSRRVRRSGRRFRRRQAKSAARRTRACRSPALRTGGRR